MRSFSFRSALKRLEKLEHASKVDGADEGVDGVFWDCRGGGLWGHQHTVMYSKSQRSEQFPCTDEEEIQWMRRLFEDFHHRFFGQGEELSFPDFLELYDYLGPPSLAEQRKAAIQKLRDDANGAK